MTIAQEAIASASAPRAPAGDRVAEAAATENFPLVSRLLPRRSQAQIMAFYRYARTADDAADDPNADPATRLARLDALEAGLRDGPGDPSDHDRAIGAALRSALEGRPEARVAAAGLLPAFRRDASGPTRCADWDDLMGYCASSAEPVGRFLLRLEGEAPEADAPSDALCSALQVLNHLQDLRADWRGLGRRYLPGDWMVEAGAADEDLGRDAATPALALVVERTLDATAALIHAAAPLPDRIASRGLRVQAATTLSVARRLHARLGASDPLSAHVRLPRVDVLSAAATGLLRWRA